MAEASPGEIVAAVLGDWWSRLRLPRNAGPGLGRDEGGDCQEDLPINRDDATPCATETEAEPAGKDTIKRLTMLDRNRRGGADWGAPARHVRNPWR